MAYDSESKPVNADLLILQRARDRVAKGWTQNSYGLKGGPVCATGAIMLERPSNDPGLSHYNLLLGFDGAPGRWLTNWNDTKDRTQAQVLERFDQAIDRLARS